MHERLVRHFGEQAVDFVLAIDKRELTHIVDALHPTTLDVGEVGVSYLCRYVDTLGYAFVDMDSNGIAELLIGTDKEIYTDPDPEQLRGLEHVLGMLQERERELIRLRYREERSLAECGKRLGFSSRHARWRD